MTIRHALPQRGPERAFVVAIGFFDGFHLGHRAIVHAALRLRRAGERTASRGVTGKKRKTWVWIAHSETAMRMCSGKSTYSPIK